MTVAATRSGRTLAGVGPAEATVARGVPVVGWPVAGALLVAGTAFFVAKWALGPNFTPIPVGPDQPPDWMRAVLMTGQLAMCVAGVAVLWWYVVRPWRRERRVPTVGLIALACGVASFWDPLSNALQPWLSYNSYLWNRGSPVSELPFVLSSPTPAVQPAWPLAFVFGGYIGFLPMLGIFGAWVMRVTKRRFPTLRAPGLIAVCVGLMAILDLVIEGVVFMPLGFWSYAGGWQPALFGGRYYQLPLHNIFHASLFFALPSILLYFVDDKGRTVVERGLDCVGGGSLRQTAVRFFAVSAFIVGGYGLVYHLPQGVLWAPNSPGWIKAVTNERSYFLNQCGPRVDRACPGRDVPIVRPRSGYVDWEGRYVTPGER